FGDHADSQREERVGATAYDRVGQDRGGGLRTGDRDEAAEGSDCGGEDRLRLGHEVRVVQLAGDECGACEISRETEDVAGSGPLIVQVREPPKHACLNAENHERIESATLGNRSRKKNASSSLTREGVRAIVEGSQSGFDSLSIAQGVVAQVRIR